MVRFTGILEWSRRLNLRTLRCLSLSLIFLSFTPLASLWVVLISWGFKPDHIPIDEDDDILGDGSSTYESTSSSSSTLIKALKNPNATLEEILTLVLLERAHTLGGTNAMARHWATVIPWALSMVFGFVLPIILYILSLMRSRRIQQSREANHSEYRKIRRKNKIMARLSPFSMTLKEEDRDTEAPPGIPGSAESWKIPFPGSVVRDDDDESSCSHNSQQIDACSLNAGCRGCRSENKECAICLNDYAVGDKVVWSQFQCCHVFHLECLADWYSVKRRKQYLCPCCRQIFFTKR